MFLKIHITALIVRLLEHLSTLMLEHFHRYDELHPSSPLSSFPHSSWGLALRLPSMFYPISKHLPKFFCKSFPSAHFKWAFPPICFPLTPNYLPYQFLALLLEPTHLTPSHYVIPLLRALLTLSPESSKNPSLLFPAATSLSFPPYIGFALSPPRVSPPPPYFPPDGETSLTTHFAESSFSLTHQEELFLPAPFTPAFFWVIPKPLAQQTHPWSSPPPLRNLIVSLTQRIHLLSA